MRITQGRSMCPACHTQLAWYDNIPVFSFLHLGGRCRTCRSKISSQYIIVELIIGILFVFEAWNHNILSNFLSPELVRDWAIIFFLAFIFLYDWKYQEIVDFTTIPTSIILFLMSVASGWHTWQSLFLGILVGGGFFLLQYLISKGRWIGGGDVRLGMFIGVILGWPNIIVSLFLAYVLGALVSLIQVARQKKEFDSQVPFGVFLTVATLVAMTWGDQLVGWYLGLIK